MSALAISASLLALAGQCIPPGGDSLGTLLTIAHAESGLSPLTIHDNTMRGAILPATKEAAVATATALIAAGHSVDLGFMQITSRNLSWLGLTVREAFELCPSIRAGDRVLHAGFDPCVDAGGEPQHCLMVAASAYNTGSPTRGFANGYVHRIAATAQHVIPEIRVAGVSPAPASPPVVSQSPPAPLCAPSWDGWALATCLSRRLPRAPATPETP